MSNKDIYQKICEAVVDPDFNEGQMNFFTKNCLKFTDDEENRHEYKEIHEEYISILEQAIEAQLKQTYSEEEINAFYLDFASNFESYRPINENAY